MPKSAVGTEGKGTGLLRYLLISLALCLLCLPGSTQSSLNRAERAETFRIVWETVRDRYFDPDFGGVDWQAVRKEMEPSAISAASDSAFYEVLQQMVDRLGQSHFRVMPPFWASTRERVLKGSASAGIDISTPNDEVLVWRMKPEVREQLPTLRPGCVLLQAGDVVFAELRQQITKELAKAPQASDKQAYKDLHGDAQSDVQSEFLETAGFALTGRYGETLSLQYRCGDASVHQGSVKLRSYAKEYSEQMGNVPRLETEFEVRQLEGDVIAIRFNLFVMSLLPRIRQAIQQAAADGRAGIVFDVRGNPGGIGTMANGLAGYLLQTRASLGVMKLRTAQLKFLAFPQEPAYLGPVAVLIDGHSASTSEIFAAGLQELGRAIVVGERSMGAALPSYFIELPHGAMLQFAVADYLTAGGKRIEGAGVEPDVPVVMDAPSLLSGLDPQLEAARKAVLRKAQQSAIVVTGF